MKLASILGVILAVLAIGHLAVVPIVPLNLGGDFSQKTIIRVIELEDNKVDEILSKVTELAAIPKVLLKSENFLLLEISKPYSENMEQTLRRSFSELGISFVEVSPVSPAFSLSVGQLLVSGIVSFILVGIVAFIVSRRRKAAILFPLMCLLTLAETVGILSLVIPIDSELLLASAAISILFPLASGIFLLNPIKSQEGMRRVRVSAFIFLAGIFTALISLSVLSLITGVFRTALITLVFGAAIGTANLYWLAGDLLFQPAPKEVVTYHVSF